MAKSGVTQEQLSESIRQVGGFGALKEGGGARRDNPFGASFVRGPTEAAPEPLNGRVPPASPTATVVPRTVATPVLASEPVAPPVTPPPTSPATSAATSPEPHAPPFVAPLTREAAPSRVPVPASRRVAMPVPDIAPEEEGMEKVTVLMSPYMRDSVSILARKLQRRRTQKEFRFTANTVFRAAIQVLLDTFHLESHDSINSEEELLSLIKSRKEPGP